jgi:hypothetical protein
MNVSTKSFQLLMKKVNGCAESFCVNQKKKNRLDEIPIQPEHFFQKTI